MWQSPDDENMALERMQIWTDEGVPSNITIELETITDRLRRDEESPSREHASLRQTVSSTEASANVVSINHSQVTADQTAEFLTPHSLLLDLADTAFLDSLARPLSRGPVPNHSLTSGLWETLGFVSNNTSKNDSDQLLAYRDHIQRQSADVTGSIYIAASSQNTFDNAQAPSYSHTREQDDHESLHERLRKHQAGRVAAISDPEGTDDPSRRKPCPFNKLHSDDDSVNFLCSYPRMMIKPKTYPPFVHHKIYRCDIGQILEPLAKAFCCMGAYHASVKTSQPFVYTMLSSESRMLVHSFVSMVLELCFPKLINHVST